MHESLSGVQRYAAGATNVNVAPVARANRDTPFKK
eukprot:COSAG02_NODE_200_length_29507_cov_440.183487_7_plen_35_part_00